MIYNYKKAFSQPVVIRKINQNSFLFFPIPVKKASVFLLVLVIDVLLLQRLSLTLIRVIPWLQKPILTLLYVGLPLLAVYCVDKLSPDGMGVFSYLNNMRSFLLRRYQKKTITYHDQLLKNAK